jgi:hypothetical protein
LQMQLALLFAVLEVLFSLVTIRRLLGSRLQPRRSIRHHRLILLQLLCAVLAQRLRLFATRDTRRKSRSLLGFLGRGRLVSCWRGRGCRGGRG